MMLTVFLSLAAVQIGICLWGRVDVSRFLQTNSSLHDPAALTSFKALVRRNMIVAILGLGLGLVWCLMAMLMVWQFGLLGMLMVLAVAVPLFLLGKSTKKLELQARSLPCPDPRLEAEYHQIGQSWSSKLLPDF